MWDLRDNFLQNRVRNCLDFLSFAFYEWFFREEHFFGTVKSPKVKILTDFFFLKVSAQFFENLIFARSKLEGFFFNLLHLLGAFFMAANLLNFLHKKLILYFFQVWLFNFNAILKICFKMYYRKLTKNGDTLWKTSLEPNRLP